MFGVEGLGGDEFEGGELGAVAALGLVAADDDRDAAGAFEDFAALGAVEGDADLGRSGCGAEAGFAEGGFVERALLKQL